MSAREDLRQKLCMLLISKGIPDTDIEIDAILGEYEVQERITEVAIRSEDRNEYKKRRRAEEKAMKGVIEGQMSFEDFPEVTP